MQRCNICIEEKCGGKKDCCCDTCTKIDTCNKYLKATVRVTTACTQSCAHCCFECSPAKKDHMTVETTRQVSTFLINNDVQALTIMGGEFWLNPDYKEVVTALVDGFLFVRIVTNGDWAEQKSEVAAFLASLQNEGRIIKVSISNDEWHTNRNVKEAVDFCIAYGLEHDMAEGITENSVVPVGRAEDSFFGFYYMLGCFCQSPTSMYSFLIVEDGGICKCPFGLARFAHVNDFVNGGFDVVFKKVYQKFYNATILSCARCVKMLTR